MSNHTHDPDHLLPVDSVSENNLVILEEGIEIHHTKSYGIGIDCHSKFIQVSVLVKRDLKVYEYRREFSTSSSLCQVLFYMVDQSAREFKINANFNIIPKIGHRPPLAPKEL